MINILYLHAGAELYGADKVMLDLVRNLDKTKFNPIVILPCKGPLVNHLKNQGIETIIVPYPILRRKYFNFKGVLNYCIHYLRYSKQLVHLIKSKDIGIIHVNTAAVLEGIYIKRRLRIPIIWHVHEIIVKPKLISNVLCWLIGKYANQVVAVSHAVEKKLTNSRKINSNIIRVIYNGVDNNIFNPENDTSYLHTTLRIPTNAIIVGMIGRINAWKGQADFLKAISPILIQNDRVYALIVGGVFKGEEWRKNQLIESVIHNPCSERIKILDFRNDTANIHNLIDVFVLPSINPDPLPTVVLEAMATGKPIVGYKHGGICEMVLERKNGLLAKVRSTKDLMKNINLLISNSDLRNRMGQASLKRQQELFSLRKYVSNFSLLYENVAMNNKI